MGEPNAGQFPLALVRDMRANWFDARCAFFCACDSEADAQAYLRQARRWIPAKALNRGLLRAYVGGGDDAGEWTLAIRGFHPETMGRLQALLDER